MDSSSDIIPIRSIDDVAQLVIQLYTPGNAANVNAIQRQLLQVQHSNDGWQVADTLLQHEDPSVRYFGALTFTVKLNEKDILTLDEATIKEIQLKLVSWFIHMIKVHEKSHVRNKMIAALATYVVRSPIVWKKPTTDLLVILHTGNTESINTDTPQATPANLIQTLDSQTLITLLLFEQTLAEELGQFQYTPAIRSRLKERFNLELDACIALVKTGLLLPASPGQDIAPLRAEALICVERFCNVHSHCSLDNKGKIESLIPCSFPSLMDGETSTEATGTFIELFDTNASFFKQEHLEELVDILQYNYLPSLHESIIENDIKEKSDFSMLLIGYCTAAIPMAAEHRESRIAQFVFRIMSEISNCNGWPGFDDSLSPMANDFWSGYVDHLTDDFDGDAAELEKALAVFVRMMPTLLKKSRMPPSEVTSVWTKEEAAAYREFRQDVTDILALAYPHMSEQIVDICIGGTLQALAIRDWSGVEIGLHTMTKLADDIVADSEGDTYLSRIFESSLLHDVAESQQDIPLTTRKVAVSFLGEVCAFLERQPQFLPQALELTISALQYPSIALHAATKMNAICSDCRLHLTSHLNVFLQQSQAIVARPDCFSRVKSRFIGATTSIIQALDDNRAQVAPLLALLEIVESDLTRARQFAGNGEMEKAGEAATTALLCLADMGRGMRAQDDEIGDALAEATEFWTVGEGAAVQQRIIACFDILRELHTDADMIDAVCQVLQSGFTETKPGPFVLSPAVTAQFLAICTVETPQVDTVLTTAMTMLIQHSRPGSTRIPDEARSIAEQTFTFMSAIGQASQDPALAASCLEVVSSLFPKYAICLLGEPEAKVEFVLNFAIQAIEGDANLPKREACELWRRIVSLRPSKPEMGVLVDRTLEKYGPLLVLALVRQITGIGQRSELHVVSTVIKALFAERSAIARRWFEAALMGDQLPPIAGNVGVAHKQRLVAQLVQLRGGSRTKDVVLEFFAACRGTIVNYR